MRGVIRVGALALVVAVLIAGPASAAVSASGAPIDATSGQSFSGLVATFTSTPGTFTATIDWGDGSRAAGTVSCTNCGNVRTPSYQVVGSHTWSSPGTYTVTTTISGAAGGTASSTARVVAPAVPPVVVLSQPAAVRVGVPATLDASRSHGGEPLRFRWDVDGSGAFALDTGSTPTLARGFSRSGDHTVSVRVTNAAGLSADAGAVVHVLASPQATFRLPQRPRARRAVRLTMPLTTPPGTKPLYYIWSWGDKARGSHRVGQYEIGGNVDTTTSDTNTHRWHAAGLYPVQVTAVDTEGGMTTFATDLGVCAVSNTTQARYVASSTCAGPGGTFKPKPAGIAFQDGPNVGQSVEFSIAVPHAVPGQQNAIEKPCSHDVVTGAPINCLQGSSAPIDVPTPTITWDFGDGATATNNPGIADHAYAQLGSYTVSVTLDYGSFGAATSKATVHVVPPPLCSAFDVNGFTVVPKGCLVAHSISSSVVYQTDPNAGVTIDGVAFTGTILVDRTTGTVGPVQPNAKVDLRIGGTAVATTPGVTLANAPLTFTLHGFFAGGTSIAGGTLQLQPGGAATIAPTIVLPKPFAGKVLSDPIPVSSGAPAGLPGEYTVSAPTGFSLEGVEIDDLVVVHHADGSWTGTGAVVIPGGTSIQLGPGGPAGFPAKRGIGFTNAGISYVGGRASFAPGSIPITPFFYLDFIGLSIDTNGVFKLDGDVGLTTMPVFNLFGKPLVHVTGCMTIVYATIGPQDEKTCEGGKYVVPGSGELYLHAFGEVDLLGVPFGNAVFDYHSATGTVSFAGSMSYSIADGAFSVDGEAAGSFSSLTKWQIGPVGIHGCEHIIGDHCLGVDVLVSSNGIVGCADILGWNVGAWYRWNGAFGVVSHACSVGSSGNVALQPRDLAGLRGRLASPTAAVTLPKGLPFALLTVHGATPPRVVVTGPGGVTITDPGAESARTGPGRTAVMHSVSQKETLVFIDKPAAGTWHVSAQAGSPVITSVESADGLAAPVVHATVTGRGLARRLAYSVSAPGGEQVTLAEQIGTSRHTLGVAHGARGTLSFAPGPGPAGSRKLLALVDLDGVPQQTLTVGSYVAPAPTRLRAPAVTVRRSGSSIAVSWRAVPGAAQYRVVTTVSDGRQESRLVKGTVLVLRGSGVGVSASVVAIGSDGRAGRAASASLKALPAKLPHLRL